MKKLQAEWKTVGPLRRAKSEALWTRFRAAADTFFERFHHRHEIALAGKMAEREAWFAELEALSNTEGEAPEGLTDKVQALRTQWNRAVPIPTAEFRALADRWQQTLAAIVAKWPDAFKGTDVDPAAAVQRMEKLVGKAETLLEQLQEAAPAPAKGLSQTELLAMKLRSALANNAMGRQDDSKWRSAVDSLKDMQASWQRMPPVPGDEAEALRTRFTAATRKINDLVRKNMPQSSGSGGGGGHKGGGGGGPKGGGHRGGDRHDRGERHDRGGRPQRPHAGTTA
jgi:hypothetical protein